MNKKEVEELEKKVTEEYRQKMDAIRLVQQMLEHEAKNSVKASDPSLALKTPRLIVPRGRMDSDNGGNDDDLDETLIGNVAAIFAADGAASWTIPKIERFLRESGVTLHAKNPKASISGAIKRLCKKGVIHLVKKGSGRIPNKYRAVEQPK